MLEHPMISEINRTGYPKEMLGSGFENAVIQPEHAGIDFFGDEIIEGDEIIIDKENFGEIILKEHFKRYLEERCDFEFFNLHGMGVVLDKSNLKVFAEQDLEKVCYEEYGFQFTTAK